MHAYLLALGATASLSFGQYQIIIVSGQSNCSSGNANELGPPWTEEFESIPYAYHTNAHIGGAGPLRPQSNGGTMGPELALGRALFRHRPAIPFAVFKDSVSGSAMALSPTQLDWNIRSDDELLDRLLADTAAFLAEVPGEIRAVLWVQGEGDSYYGRAEVYGTRLVEFDAALAQAWAEDAVLVPCLMAPQADRYTAVEERIQSTLAAGYTWAIPVSDLQLKDDLTHLTSESQILFGERMADWIISTLYPCPADWQGDGEIDALDVLQYLNNWAAGEEGADLNEDGSVDTLDFLAFLNAWTEGC